MSITSHVPGEVVTTLFADLVDDAAMFPPGSASPASALRTHRAWRSSGHTDVVGPLLVHVDRWVEFAIACDADPGEIRIGLIGTTELPASTPRDVSVVGFEVVSVDGDVPGCAGRLAVEPAALDIVEDLLANIGEARIGGRPVVAKFRTGGVTAGAFPTEAELAYNLLAAFNAGVPFKLTAGLHHAVRNTATDTGFEQHGFLNVIVAVERCHAGAGLDELGAILAVRDAGELLRQLAQFSVDDAIGVRSTFLSFGCCGVGDPLSDLVALGLLGGGR